MDPDDRDSPAYKGAFREAVYATLFELAREHLQRGPVVIAGPFTREGGEVDGLSQIEKAADQQVTVHFVWCDPAVRRRRVEARGEDRDLPKLADWETYVATCREERPCWPHRYVDTSGG